MEAGTGGRGQDSDQLLPGSTSAVPSPNSRGSGHREAPPQSRTGLLALLTCLAKDSG